MNDFFKNDKLSRRSFVAGSVLAAGALPAMLKAEPGGALLNPQDMTIKQLMDLIIKDIPGAPFSNTVDTLKSGEGSQKITGVVTCMFPTIEVIRKTAALKSNFIICHEPTFYNHSDETGWLADDKVYEFKRNLLASNKIAVWRFHDYIHTHVPDGVRAGVLTKLEWAKYQDKSNPAIVNLAPTLLKDILAHVKSKLGIANLRMIGDLKQVCQKILLLPGAPGGRSQITQLMQTQPDLLIGGESAEWETPEYIRDAMSAGLKKSLILLGHAQSEEPGMDWLIDWLKANAPSLKATHIPSNNPFTFA